MHLARESATGAKHVPAFVDAAQPSQIANAVTRKSLGTYLTAPSIMRNRNFWVLFGTCSTWFLLDIAFYAQARVARSGPRAGVGRLARGRACVSLHSGSAGSGCGGSAEGQARGLPLPAQGKAWGGRLGPPAPPAPAHPSNPLNFRHTAEPVPSPPAGRHRVCQPPAPAHRGLLQVARRLPGGLRQQAALPGGRGVGGGPGSGARPAPAPPPPRPRPAKAPPPRTGGVCHPPRPPTPATTHPPLTPYRCPPWTPPWSAREPAPWRCGSRSSRRCRATRSSRSWALCPATFSRSPSSTAGGASPSSTWALR